MSRECMFLNSLSPDNKDLERRTLKPPWCVTALGSWIDRVIALRSQMDHVTALTQISVTALFYLEDSRKIHLWGMRAHGSKDTRRRAPQRVGERELALAPLFICLSLPGPVLCKLGQPGVVFVLPEVLTPSSDLLLFHFRGLFPSFSVATTILDSSSLFYLPNRNFPFYFPGHLNPVLYKRFWAPVRGWAKGSRPFCQSLTGLFGLLPHAIADQVSQCNFFLPSYL